METWINTLDKNIAWRFLEYQDNMKENFPKNTNDIKIPTPKDFKRKN